MSASLCKDCLARWRTDNGLDQRAIPVAPLPAWAKRPTPYPGPRCRTDHVAFTRRQKAARHEKHVARNFSLEPGEYAKLLQAQGYRCPICQRRITGIGGKKAPVDHDHVTGIVLGILCSNCNRWVVTLGHAGLARAEQYLLRPPALRILGHRSGKMDP